METIEITISKQRRPIHYDTSHVRYSIIDGINNGHEEFIGWKYCVQVLSSMVQHFWTAGSLTYSLAYTIFIRDCYRLDMWSVHAWICVNKFDTILSHVRYMYMYEGNRMCDSDWRLPDDATGYNTNLASTL